MISGIVGESWFSDELGSKVVEPGPATSGSLKLGEAMMSDSSLLDICLGPVCGVEGAKCRVGLCQFGHLSVPLEQ